LALGVPAAAFVVWGLADNAKLFLSTALNGLTLAALYFLVASGFTLVFGLMRNVNLAHGSLYLLGAYVGYVVGEWTGSWLLAVAAGLASAALFGLVLQVAVFRFMHGEDLRQTLVTIGLSIMMADVLLWKFGGEIYQFDPPRAIFGRTALPIVEVYPTYRLVLLAMSAAIGVLLWWFLNRTRVGMMIRAGVDDRGMLAAAGVNVQFVFAVTFAIGAGLAGFAGVMGGTALSIAPGEGSQTPAYAAQCRSVPAGADQCHRSTRNGGTGGRANLGLRANAAGLHLSRWPRGGVRHSHELGDAGQFSGLRRARGAVSLR